MMVVPALQVAVVFEVAIDESAFVFALSVDSDEGPQPTSNANITGTNRRILLIF